PRMNPAMMPTMMFLSNSRISLTLLMISRGFIAATFFAKRLQRSNDPAQRPVHAGATLWLEAPCSHGRGAVAARSALASVFLDCLAVVSLDFGTGKHHDH